MPVEPTRPAGRPPRPDGVSPLALDVHLLGAVDVFVGGHRIEHWHGRKGMLLLAYLLLHRHRPVPRDALAVTFWPDTLPDASRNRLHVTLHALRADLQTASPIPIVVFVYGYTLNPELDVRLDTEFERAAARGDRAQDDDDTALAADRDAIGEYRGDLLSDHPYDDWTLLPREHYRVRMLDVLGQAAQLAFDTGRYPESVQTGQRLLALDFCREDLHRLLCAPVRGRRISPCASSRSARGSCARNWIWHRRRRPSNCTPGFAPGRRSDRRPVRPVGLDNLRGAGVGWDTPSWYPVRPACTDRDEEFLVACLQREVSARESHGGEGPPTS